MKRFFIDFESIDRFTLSLDCLDETIHCPHCSKSSHLISHGIIYKQRSMRRREAVGKRILCSNRYHHTGCGHTIQLNIAQVIPSLQYSAAQVFIFLSSLLMNHPLSDAYELATTSTDPRNAWRWLKKLTHKLSDFRCCLQEAQTPMDASVQSKNRRLTLLLSTLKPLLSSLPHCPCAYYQHQQQRAFI